MKNIVDKVFDNLGYRSQKLADTTERVVYQLGVGLKTTRADCFIDIRIPQKLCMIYTNSTINIPENKRKLIAEYISRANFGLLLGNFELDFEDGDLRYKCYFLYDEFEERTEKFFVSNLFASFDIVDQYFPGIMTILYANNEPKNAIFQVEKQINPIMN